MESTTTKVVVKLHEGERTNTKLWRFTSPHLYTLEMVRKEILSLFPHLVKKDMMVDLSYIDDFVGKVKTNHYGIMSSCMILSG